GQGALDLRSGAVGGQGGEAVDDRLARLERRVGFGFPRRARGVARGENRVGGRLERGPQRALFAPRERQALRVGLPLRLQRAHLVDRIARERRGLGEALRRGDEALALLAGVLVGLRERLFERPQRGGEARVQDRKSVV